MSELPKYKFAKGTTVLRLIVAALLVVMCVLKIHLTYRGLDQPAAMDQAQIARSVANWNGFTTNLLRPIDVMTVANQSELTKEPFEVAKLRDTTYAPLNIAAMAVALKLSGMDNFDATRMTDGGYVYVADRVISATSMLFFCIAIGLSYSLIARMFDELIACATSCFMLCSELFLDYSISGLPQPLMLCCLLAAMHALLSAIRAAEDGADVWALFCIVICFVFVGLMCLSGWMSLWIAGGLLLFCMIHFRAGGSYAFAAGVVLMLFLIAPAIMNYRDTGSILGNAMLGLYNSFGGGEEAVMRSATINNTPLQSSGFVLRFFSHTFSQLRHLYVNMGSIIVVPFFFLALLNRYRLNDVQAMKWAIFCMWSFACIGMALFGVNTPENPSQLAILFVPFFTAYGLSLVFNFLARIKYEHSTFTQARGLALFIMILVSAGPFLSTIPNSVYMGVWLGDRARPHFPPYYPPALNLNLVSVTRPDAVIVTDQPWAVAWYANRKALWIPRLVDDFTTYLEPTLNKGGARVGGFLITPSSHSEPNSRGGIKGIVDEMGDFAPLALEGKLLQLTPRHNLALADMFVENADGSDNSMTLGKLVSSQGRFSQRIPLLGAEIMYYTEPGSVPQNQ
ncbi:MAG: hypothetical protein IKZ07_07980 [Akkermansia sp.]|nr:hypothetical protein [Akkermansia sp.]